MNKEVPSPKEFMRQRRPERFSDSFPIEHHDLERSVLEYHLQTLTSRNQEIDFERFARAVAERVICPNLLPHTGPTGGGDSGVDTETFPVAERLAIGWYEGMGSAAAAEQWAFAFSAKKRWRPKLKSDLNRIAEAKRAYTKVFFITNQFVKDKDRATVQDEHRRNDLELVVLDRAWLVEAVLKHGLEGVAIATLGVPDTIQRDIRKGPRDTQRELELQESEARIQASLVTGGHDLRVVDDSLHSALAARSLERPRLEVDGRFLRARNLAGKLGTRHQKVKVAYEWAWATYWWFEDATTFNDLYRDAEVLIIGSESVYDLELLSNLWTCLHTAVDSGSLSRSTSALEERTKRLLGDLRRLRNDKKRLGTSLHARTLELQLGLIREPTHAGQTFSRLRAVVRRAARLVNYPFDTFAQLIIEMGEPFGQVEGYTALFEDVVGISAKRQGELTAARLLVQRAAQLLEQNRFYEAIATLGPALTNLYKDESRGDVVRALYMCGHAYAQVGLRWAARGAFVNAASIATEATWSRGKVTRLQSECYDRIRWLELELGRLPQSLAWHEALSAVETVLAQQGQGDREERLEAWRIFDGVVGITFLRAQLSTLRILEALPAALERLFLPASAIALFFSLGHENEIPPEWKEAPESGTSEGSLFQMWRDQPASEELPAAFSVGLEPSLLLESRILGCHVRVECENAAPCVDLAESVLAALESFLSTGLAAGVIAHEPLLSITVRRSEYAESPFTFNLIEDHGQPKVIVACRAFAPHSVSHGEQAAIQDRLARLLTMLFARVFFPGDVEKATSKMMGEERALERAVGLTKSFVTVGNVLGSQPKSTITDWMRNDDPVYPLTRLEEWDAAERETRHLEYLKKQSAREKATPKAAPSGEPPADLLQGRWSAKQNEIKTISLIRLTLWDQAIWRGVGTIVSPGDIAPPILALIFENGKAATQIFEAWRSELGDKDVNEHLRVSIVRGFSRATPAAYRVLIGTDLRVAVGSADTKYALTTFRIHTLEPKTTDNVDRFLASYAAVRRYMLAPAVVVEGRAEPAIGFQLGLEKTVLYVRSAWQVGPNDPEVAAIMASDDPIIPAGEVEVPVAEVIKRKRSKQTR